MITKKRTTILFDAGPMLDSSKTGIGFYVSHIIDALSAKYKSVNFEGYYFNFLSRHKPYTNPSSLISLKEIRFFPSKLLSLCRRMGFQPNIRLLIKNPLSHVLFTNYIALPVSDKTHVTLFIYDLGFMDYPEFLQETNLEALKKFCPKSIMRADVIVTISEFTKERILHYFPDTNANIIVTPIPPVVAKSKKSALNERLRKLGIIDKKYLLYLGTLEPRKNISKLIQAYSKLPNDLRSEYSLVLAGGKGWKDHDIIQEIRLAREKGLSVIQTGYVSEQEKRALYSQATCFIMPSHYEGFGMPVLEAMSYEIPVALSDIPVFHEVAKDGALYFDKDNVHDITKKLATIVNDPKTRKKLVEKGNQILTKFESWDDNAQRIMNATQDN